MRSECLWVPHFSVVPAEHPIFIAISSIQRIFDSLLPLMMLFQKLKHLWADDDKADFLLAVVLTLDRARHNAFASLPLDRFVNQYFPCLEVYIGPLDTQDLPATLASHNR